jgi:hypothetical protein
MKELVWCEVVERLHFRGYPFQYCMFLFAILIKQLHIYDIFLDVSGVILYIVIPGIGSCRVLVV